MFGIRSFQRFLHKPPFYIHSIQYYDNSALEVHPKLPQITAILCQGRTVVARSE